MRFVALVVALVLVIGGCLEKASERRDSAQAYAPSAVGEQSPANQPASNTQRAEAPAEDQEPDAGISLPAAADVLPDLIIRTGPASIQVDSLDAAIAMVRALARRVGGFVAGSSTQASRGSCTPPRWSCACRLDGSMKRWRGCGRSEKWKRST